MQAKNQSNFEIEKVWKSDAKSHPKWRQNTIKNQCKIHVKSRSEKERKIVEQTLIFWKAETRQNTVRVIKNRGFANQGKRPEKYQKLCKNTSKIHQQTAKNRNKIDVVKCL